MARQKGAIPTKPLTVHLPVDVLSKLQLHLFSEVEGRVPHGAYSAFIGSLINFHLAAMEEAAAAIVANPDITT